MRLRNLRNLLFVAWLIVFGCSGESSQRTFSIATGGPAGLYYPYGGGMASIWSKQLVHVNAKAEVTGGSVTNVIQVARKESDLGIAMADVVTDAYLGQGRFPQSLPIRVLFTAYPNIVHILTLKENNIQGIADLRGKRVSLGAAGSGTAVAAQNVLTGLNVELSDLAAVYLSFGETTAALKDGTIDAGFVVGGLGLAAVTELAVTRNLHLIALTLDEIQQLNERFPAYSAYTIPAGTYDKVDADVSALGIWSAVVVHEDMSEQLAFELTCTIYKHREALLKISPVANDMTVANIYQLASVPLHPGSMRFAADPIGSCET